MKGPKVTNTEYLLRTVRESERMQGWQDAFSKLREDISKMISRNEPEKEKEAFEAEDALEI